MKNSDLTLLQINPHINDLYFNNSSESQNKKALLKDQDDFAFPLKYNNFFSEKTNENLSFEKFKTIMDDADITKSEIEEDDISELYFLKKQKEPKIEFQSTFNTSKNISFTQDKTYIDIKDYFLNRNINFKTVLHRKRGRKCKKNEKRKKYLNKYHGSSDFDNVQRKIQVNFITFLVKLANDAIKTVLGKGTKYFFKDLRYDLKKIVSHKYVEDLKKCKYSDIIQMKISLKNKHYGENLNRDTFLEICKISPELRQYFDKNYLYIFQKYYFGLKNNQNIIDFDGLKIELSPMTKGFLNLLRKNECGKEKFKNVIKDVYFSGLNYINEEQIRRSKPFVITSIDKKNEE